MKVTIMQYNRKTDERIYLYNNVKHSGIEKMVDNGYNLIVHAFLFLSQGELFHGRTKKENQNDDLASATV